MKIHFDSSALTALIDNVYDGIFLTDDNGVIIYWNRSAQRITGYKSDEIVGRTCSETLVVLSDRGRCLCGSRGCSIRKALCKKSVVETNVYFRHKHGQRIPVTVKAFLMMDKDNKRRVICQVLRDNSPVVKEKRKLQALRKKAMLDDVTDIGNRRFGQEKIRQAIHEFKRNGRCFGLLFCDIDDFKDINDTHGHQTGDRVLVMTARTLQKNIRSFDIVCRWGGDEFVLIVANVNRDELAEIAEKLCLLIQNSGFDFGSESVNATVSIGGTVVQEGDTKKAVLDRADAKMYQCKEAGKNRIAIG